MLLPDNIHPELSIYYNGAIVLQLLQEKPKQKISELYADVKKYCDMSFPVLILSLDWLYIANMAVIDDNGEVRLCT